MPEVRSPEIAEASPTNAGEGLDLAIVIVTYNVRDLLRSCLASIPIGSGQGEESLRSRVYVVDNGSTDESLNMVRTEFPQYTTLLSEKGAGYALANNLAIRQARTDLGGVWPRYVLLLNPDTELPPGSLFRMVRFLDAHPEAGVAGPRLVRSDGSLDRACRRSFPSPMVSFYHMAGLSRLFPGSRRFGRYNLSYLAEEAVCEIDSVVGAFMLVRSSLLDAVGLLDESFFMYGEDLDWAFRIKARGWRVFYNGKVTVYHHKGASSSQRALKTTYEFYRAMLLFYLKHYAESTPRLLGAAIVTGIYLSGGIALGRNLLGRLGARVVGQVARPIARKAKA